MGISESKKKIVIDNYFKRECDVNTSIKEAFTKGFELGLKKASIPQQTRQTEWIPVSERLPKVDEYIVDVARYYLVQNVYGDMLVARYRGEYWVQMYQRKPIDDEIVAWMPLPSTYQAESEK